MPDPTTPQPVPMPPNVLDHYYVGGANIAELRKVDRPSPRRPEEWLAATVPRADDATLGLSPLPDGTLLRDAIAADPLGWLNTDRNGTDGDTGILVKLLDAGQRLPVHVHPTRSFAREHLHSGYGKTEAWYILRADGDDPSVWVGFSADVEPKELAARVDDQDSEWMLAHLNKIPVRPGDGIVVPAGTAHATGAGVFLVEVQEPTDFSILLEWSATTSTRHESHLGLGFDTALQALDHRALPATALADLLWHTDIDASGDHPIPALAAAADEFFRLHVLAPYPGGSAAVAAGFAVVVVIEGSGRMVPSGGLRTAESLDLRRGDVLAVPAGFGPWRLAGPVRAVLCRASAGWPGNVRRATTTQSGASVGVGAPAAGARRSG